MAIRSRIYRGDFEDNRSKRIGGENASKKQESETNWERIIVICHDEFKDNHRETLWELVAKTPGERSKFAGLGCLYIRFECAAFFRQFTVTYVEYLAISFTIYMYNADYIHNISSIRLDCYIDTHINYNLICLPAL